LKKKLNFKVKNYINLQLYKSFDKVNFYTFQFENQDLTETEKFFTKFENNTEVEDSLNNIAVWLSLLGQKYGAKQEFFRHEADAQALPPPMNKMLREVIVNDLRLYCVCISDKIVILANGGIKTSQKVQDSPDLLPHFRFANEMSKQISTLIREGDLKFLGKNILNFSQIELTY
jgi:hypothetical protein